MYMGASTKLTEFNFDNAFGERLFKTNDNGSYGGYRLCCQVTPSFFWDDQPGGTSADAFNPTNTQQVTYAAIDAAYDPTHFTDRNYNAAGATDKFCFDNASTYCINNFKLLAY